MVLVFIKLIGTKVPPPLCRHNDLRHQDSENQLFKVIFK